MSIIRVAHSRMVSRVLSRVRVACPRSHLGENWRVDTPLPGKRHGGIGLRGAVGAETRSTHEGATLGVRGFSGGSYAGEIHIDKMLTR